MNKEQGEKENETFDPGHVPDLPPGKEERFEPGAMTQGDQGARKEGAGDERAYSRENFEPNELSNPLPKWYSAMALGFVIWGGGYFYFQGNVPADAGDHRSVLATMAGPADGATVYAGNCVACHQATGLGLAGAFPPLAGSGWVLGEPDLLAQILLHGIQGEIEVMGNVYNGVMPAFPQLSDAELAAVQNHVRNEWGNEAAEVDDAFYAEQRERFPPDRGPWQGGAELREIVAEPLAVGGS